MSFSNMAMEDSAIVVGPPIEFSCTVSYPCNTSQWIVKHSLRRYSFLLTQKLMVEKYRDEKLEVIFSTKLAIISSTIATQIADSLFSNMMAHICKRIRV